VRCILMPVRLAVKLEDPQILSSVISDIREERIITGGDSAPLLLIVEDADEILTERNTGDISAISSLLNLADGIFGSLIDVRIIATTNAQEVEIDKALLRPGRLLEKVQIKALPAEQANKIYERLSGAPGNFQKDVTLSEIYAKAGNFKNKKTKENKKTPMGFKT